MNYLVLSILIFVTLTAVKGSLEEEKEKLKKLTTECVKETGVTIESLRKLRSHEDVDDPKLKEYAFCTFKKNGFMDEEGELQVGVIKSTLQKISNEDEVNKVVDKCVVKKDSPQETAYDTVTCWNRLNK